jgi:hypothetical protein
MASRRQIRDELNKRAIALPNMKGKQYTAQEKDEYFAFVRKEKARTGQDPTSKIVEALKKANNILDAQDDSDSEMVSELEEK